MTYLERRQRMAKLRAEYGDRAISRYLYALETLRSINAPAWEQVTELELMLLDGY
jgi:negative regulator of replication initiation